jgi:glycosyltransferase involved in cell wall biosynthesis
LKLDILIVNMNHGHYLRQCLDSISKQTFQDFRVLLQDGNSRDSSLSVAQQFRFIEIESKKDLGSNDAFSKAIARSSSEYITFLTSTDYFLDSDWLANAVTTLDSNTSISMIVGGIVGVTNEGGYTNYRWPTIAFECKDFSELYFDFLFRGNGMTPISFVIRREIFLRCIGDLTDFMKEDHECDEDLFWRFSLGFHKKPFASWYLKNDQVACRLHTDRRSDSTYLPTQQERLNKSIKLLRRSILLKGKSIEFVRMDLNNDSKLSISYLNLLCSWLKYSLKKLFQRMQKMIGVINSRDQVVSEMYR